MVARRCSSRVGGEAGIRLSSRACAAHHRKSPNCHPKDNMASRCTLLSSHKKPGGRQYSGAQHGRQTSWETMWWMLRGTHRTRPGTPFPAACVDTARRGPAVPPSAKNTWASGRPGAGSRSTPKCARSPAAWLRSGFKRGMNLAIVGDNRPRLYWAMLAAQSLGGVPVPLYQDAPAADMAYVLERRRHRLRRGRRPGAGRQAARADGILPPAAPHRVRGRAGHAPLPPGRPAVAGAPAGPGPRLGHGQSRPVRCRRRSGQRQRRRHHPLHLRHHRQTQRACAVARAPCWRPAWAASASTT